MYFSQRSILFPGAGSASPPAPAWGKAVAISTPDGETLHALYSKSASGKPSVLFFLGNADRAGNYAFLAEALAAQGIGLLAISYRGYPGSTGSPSESGLLTDGLAAFDWLSAQGSGGIVLLGQSLGSGVARQHRRATSGNRRHPGIRLPVGPLGRAGAVPVPSGRPADQGSVPLRPAHRRRKAAEAVHPRPTRHSHPAFLRRGAVPDRAGTQAYADLRRVGPQRHLGQRHDAETIRFVDRTASVDAPSGRLTPAPAWLDNSRSLPAWRRRKASSMVAG